MWIVWVLLGIGLFWMGFWWFGIVCFLGAWIVNNQ